MEKLQGILLGNEVFVKEILPFYGFELEWKFLMTGLWYFYGVFDRI